MERTFANLASLSASSSPRERLHSNIISISPGEEGKCLPVTVTCGIAQVQKHMEYASFQSQNTFLSMPVLLAIERKKRPSLTHTELLSELLARKDAIKSLRQSPEQHGINFAPYFNYIVSYSGYH